MNLKKVHVLVSVLQWIGWKRTSTSTSTTSSTSIVAIRILALVLCIISITTTIHNYKLISYYEFEQQQQNQHNYTWKLTGVITTGTSSNDPTHQRHAHITTRPEESASKKSLKQNQEQKRSLSVMTTSKSISQKQQQQHKDDNDGNTSSNSTSDHEINIDNDLNNYTSTGEQPIDLSNDNSFSLQQEIVTNDEMDNKKKKSDKNDITVQVPIEEIHDTTIISTNTTTNIHHTHKIPNNIIFTYKINLVTTTFDFYNISHELLTVEQKELLALQNNVHRIIQLHNTTTNNTITNTTTNIYFLTDIDCIESIKRVIPLIYNRSNDNTSDIVIKMIYYFINEKEGMYKGDLCRGIALYEYGGLYIDVDLGVRMNIYTVIQQHVEFVTIKVHSQSHHKHCFFQAFIGVTQYNTIIQRYIHLFYQYYTGTILNHHTLIGKPLGVVLLKRAYDEIIHEQQQLIQQQQQLQYNMLDHFDGDLQTITTNTNHVQNIASTTTTSVTHIQETTEIWEEVLYNKNMLQHHWEYIKQTVPYPKYGLRRACHFIVRIPYNNIVPFYSRIEGSRLCPSWDDIVKQHQHDITKQQQQKQHHQQEHQHEHTNDKEEHHHHDHHDQHHTNDEEEHHHHHDEHQHHDKKHQHQNAHVADKI